MVQCIESRAEALLRSGFATLCGPFATADEAFDAAASLLVGMPVDPGFPSLGIIGDFVVPPIGGPPSRDFQTLHFDFGLPVDPVGPGDVARYTALYIPTDCPPSTAHTRLVPLNALLAQVSWPDRDELLSRLVSYGEVHGGRDDVEGYIEGSFARIVEGAAGGEPQLPSVKADPDFLCGNEFHSLAAELDFFKGHGLSVLDAQRDIIIEAGTVAVFDNLALTHGRRGRRRPGELRQRVFGHRALGVEAQRTLRDRVLGAFSSGSS
jgi:hypothetical protein